MFDSVAYQVNGAIARALNLPREELDAFYREEGCHGFSRGYGLAVLTAQQQMLAARRALGIVNRLNPGPFKAQHSSRVFANLNRRRAQFRLLQEYAR